MQPSRGHSRAPGAVPVRAPVDGLRRGPTGARRIALAVGAAMAIATLFAAAAPPRAGAEYWAHEAGGLIPNDTGIPGQGGAPGDWQTAQWNFTGQFGVQAPQAWANTTAEGAPGGKGVIVAVLDTGVAYANRGPFRRSPGLQPMGVRAGV